MIRRLLVGVLLVAAPALAADTFALTGPALVQYREAVSRVEAGAYGPATELLNALAAQYPRVPEIFATRCSAQVGLRNFAAAEADCAYALKVQPGFPPALYGLAAAEEGQGKLALALGHYRQYVSSNDARALYKAQAQARIDALTGPPGALPVPPPPAPTGTVQAPPVVPAASYGTLVVYKNHFLGGVQGARPISLVLDGQVLGGISQDQYVELEVPAGEHLLEARFGVLSVFEVVPSLSVPVRVVAGQRTYANFDTVNGFNALQTVGPTQAQREIREDCRKAWTRRL